MQKNVVTSKKINSEIKISWIHKGESPATIIKMTAMLSCIQESWNETFQTIDFENSCLYPPDFPINKGGTHKTFF